MQLLIAALSLGPLSAKRCAQNGYFTIEATKYFKVFFCCSNRGVKNDFQEAHSQRDMCKWDVPNLDSGSCVEAPLINLSAKKTEKRPP